MKLSFLPHAMLLVVAGVLAACGGGGKAKFDVAGVVAGLKYDGLILTNNGGSDLAVPAGATSFKFPGNIEYGDAYAVDIKKMPDHQTCGIGLNKDTAGRMASIQVEIGCNMIEYAIGGKITGLNADGLVLINGSDARLTVAKDSTAYAFSQPLVFDQTYGVTVLTQPTNGLLTCSVANGVGKVQDANVTNIDISCVPK